jgi:hypothetical protein
MTTFYRILFILLVPFTVKGHAIFVHNEQKNSRLREPFRRCAPYVSVEGIGTPLSFWTNILYRTLNEVDDFIDDLNNVHELIKTNPIVHEVQYKKCDSTSLFLPASIERSKGPDKHWKKKNFRRF